MLERAPGRARAGADDASSLGDRFLLGTEFENLGEQEAPACSARAFAARSTPRQRDWQGPFESG